MRKNLFLINLGFNHVYFTTANNDVLLTRTAKELYNFMQYSRSSILKFFSYGAFLYVVSACEGHQMVEFLVIITVWPLKINLLALTVLSDLDSMFISSIPHWVEQLWPCDKYSKIYKIKNKLNLGSKLILNLIFQKSLS